MNKILEDFSKEELVELIQRSELRLDEAYDVKSDSCRKPVYVKNGKFVLTNVALECQVTQVLRDQAKLARRLADANTEIERLTDEVNKAISTIAAFGNRAEKAERERDALFRHHDISECKKGHMFRTIASHPAKSECEWECPHCAVEDRDDALSWIRSVVRSGRCPKCMEYPRDCGCEIQRQAVGLEGEG